MVPYLSNMIFATYVGDNLHRGIGFIRAGCVLLGAVVFKLTLFQSKISYLTI